MPIVIRTPFNVFKEVEKRMRYRWKDKERERSNRARGYVLGGAIAHRCVMRHDQIAWSGPPHDIIRHYVCLRCHAAASEPEIKYYGHEFETITLEQIHEIMDLDLERQRLGSPHQFHIG